MNLYSKELMFLAKKNTASQGILEDATHEYTAKNPICGDRVRWTAIVEDRKIIDLKHHTKGCLLCKAGATLLFEQVHSGSRKTPEVQELICHYSTQIEQLKTDDVLDNPAEGLDIFTGLSKAPSRVSCVLLPFTGLQKALGGSQK